MGDSTIEQSATTLQEIISRNQESLLNATIIRATISFNNSEELFKELLDTNADLCNSGVLTKDEIYLVCKAIIQSAQNDDQNGVKITSYALGIKDNLPIEVVGANYGFQNHQSFITSRCAEQGMYSSCITQSVAFESIKTIVVTTAGQNNPLQCCPACRNLLLKKFNPDTKLILLSHNKDGKVTNLGTNTLGELSLGYAIKEYENSDVLNGKNVTDFQLICDKILKNSSASIPPYTKDKLEYEIFTSVVFSS